MTLNYFVIAETDEGRQKAKVATWVAALFILRTSILTSVLVGCP